MSFHKWLHYRSVGAFLIVLFLAGASGAQSNSYPAGALRESGPSSTSPTYIEPSCRNPISSEEANFCLQRRAAEAAELQAAWNKWQVYLGIIGSAFVFFGLLANWRATVAASAAARAATEQIKLTYDLEQPLLQLKMPTSGMKMVGNKLRLCSGGPLRMTLTNVGRAPAVVTSIGREWTILNAYRYPDPVNVEAIELSKEISGLVVAPNADSRSINADCAKDVKAGDRVFLQGFVKYQNLTGSKKYQLIFSDFLRLRGSAIDGFHITWPPNDPYRYNRNEEIQHDKQLLSPPRWQFWRQARS